MQNLVQQFHETFNLTVNTSPKLPSVKDEKLRLRLITEEFLEYQEALASGDLAQIAKEGADLLYVIFGTGVTYGIDYEKAMAEVHRSNMSKVWEDGKPRYREDGKVLKPSSYSTADMSVVLGS